MRHFFWWYICLGEVLISLGALWLLMQTNHTTCTVFNVGQGDSIFIRTTTDVRVLVDAGPDATVLEALGRTLPWFDRRIDMIVLTHPDRDHLFGFPDVLRRYHVRYALVTGIEKADPRYREFMDLLKKQHVHILIADPKTDIRLDAETVLDIEWPPPVWLGKVPKDPNTTSIILRILTPQKSMLLTGDSDTAAEFALLRTGTPLRSDVLKVGHHGSRTSTSTGLLLATRPSVGIISAPIKSPFGHPHADVLARLHHYGVQTKQTGYEGDVRITLW